MTLLKCLRNGAAGEADILLVKASLDGVAAMAFAAGTNAVEHGGGLGGRATPRSEAAAPTGCSPSQPPDRRPGEHSPLVQFSSAVVGGLTALALALELLDLPAPSVGKAWPGRGSGRSFLDRMSDPGESTVLRAGLVVCGITNAGAVGPLFGVPQAWLALISVCALAALTLDAARFSGMGGHIFAEALPGGSHRLWRVATHEAGHLLAAREELIEVEDVLTGSLACARVGLSSRDSTRFAIPEHAKLPLHELHRWSRVLQADVVGRRAAVGWLQRGQR